MVVKALEQAMPLLASSSGNKSFLGRKQVTTIAERRPRSLDAFMNMSLHGLSNNHRTAYGPAIMETLRQVLCLYTCYFWWYF